MHTENIPDRRKHQRFKAREGLFASLEPSDAVGEITDISEGGLTVQYALYDRFSEVPSEVTIVSSTDSFHSKELPCRTVSDFCIKEVPFSSILVRRFGLQFKALSKEQKSQLDYCLQNYTVGYA
jgi:hypothetical protein